MQITQHSGATQVPTRLEPAPLLASSGTQVFSAKKVLVEIYGSGGAAPSTISYRFIFYYFSIFT